VRFCAPLDQPWSDFDTVFKQRIQECEAFYDGIIKTFPKNIKRLLKVRFQVYYGPNSFIIMMFLNGFFGPGEAQPIVLTRATQAGTY
jgi:hypothetical protein